MLNKLRIQNFKGWKDTGPIEMKPITLFFGSNSSGKSSVGHFLMMLKQTVQSQDNRGVFFYGDDDSAVRLGTYRDIVFGHDESEKIEFEYQWSSKEISNLFSPFPGFFDHEEKKIQTDTFNFFAKISYPKKSALMVEKFLYTNGKFAHPKTASFSLGMHVSEKDSKKYTILDSNNKLRKSQARPWPLGAPIKFYGFPNTVSTYYQNVDFLAEVNLIHEGLFNSLYYLGPLRNRPERMYSWSQNAPDSVGFSGENTIPAILSAQESQRTMNLGAKQKYHPVGAIIAQELKKLGLIEDIEIKKIAENREDYEIRVRTKGAKDFVDLTDVGFGVSQVLPVLVQCFYAPANSIIVMEQPEIHLHPSAQSILADVMIDVINSREHGSHRNIQLIIETHSEHFLRRLQRRIAENGNLRDEISAYNADTACHPARLEKLEIDMLGRIKNWPKDFFGDEMGDVLKHSDAIMKRQKEKKE